MSPESKARVNRVVQHVFRAALTASKNGESAALTNYAQTILESVVEDEVRHRLAERQAG